jgi:hypothetical protein
MAKITTLFIDKGGLLIDDTTRGRTLTSVRSSRTPGSTP